MVISKLKISLIIILLILNYNLIKLFSLTLYFSLTHKYDKYLYNCVNYSKDLTKLLNKHKINSTVVCGYDKTNTSKGHCWVRVNLNWFNILNLTLDIEPQHGLLVNYDNKFVVCEHNCLNLN